MDKKNITFYFSKETINKLKDYSAKTMIPKNRIAEKALVEYLEKNAK